MEQPMLPPDQEAPGVAEDPERAVRGPGGWLNWLAMRAGQPKRTESHTDGALLIPLWEEYGLYSDSWLTGDLVLGPARFELSFPGEDSRVGQAQMVIVLHVDNHLGDPVYDAPSPEMEDVGAYHGGGTGDEFASLLSLALGRRLRSGGVIRHRMSGTRPEGRPFYADHRVPGLAAPARGQSILPSIGDSVKIGDAKPLMDRYARVSGGDAVTVVRSANEYADALWWADLDPRIAWIKLVGALEIAAKQWSDAKGLTRLERFKQYMGKTYKKFKDTHGEEIADSVAQLWDENAGATARFVEFTTQHAPNPPAARPSPLAQVDWSNLETTLRVIYGHRSRDLHGGLPFPAPMLEAPWPMTEAVPPERFAAIAAGGQGGSWPAASMPMFLHVFAFVARQALTNWWAALPDGPLISAEHSE
jgi:hypothetical protein